MAKEIDRYGSGPAEQFRAAFDVQNAHNLSGAVLFAAQCFVLVQNGGENGVFFPSPEIMRKAAALLVETAEKWERGEIEGLPAQRRGEAMKLSCSIEVMWRSQSNYFCYECWTDITPKSRWLDHRLVGIITVG